MILLQCLERYNSWSVLTILRKVECWTFRLASHVDRTFRFLRVWLMVAVNVDKEKEREFARWQALLHCFDLVCPSYTFSSFSWASLELWLIELPGALRHIWAVRWAGKINYDKTKLEAFVLFTSKEILCVVMLMDSDKSAVLSVSWGVPTGHLITTLSSFWRPMQIFFFFPRTMMYKTLC